MHFLFHAFPAVRFFTFTYMKTYSVKLPALYFLFDFLFLVLFLSFLLQFCICFFLPSHFSFLILPLHFVFISFVCTFLISFSFPLSFPLSFNFSVFLSSFYFIFSLSPSFSLCPFPLSPLSLSLSIKLQPGEFLSTSSPDFLPPSSLLHPPPSCLRLIRVPDSVGASFLRFFQVSHCAHRALCRLHPLIAFCACWASGDLIITPCAR